MEKWIGGWLSVIVVIIVIVAFSPAPNGNLTGTDSSLQSTQIQGQNIPDPTAYVNDTANILSASVKTSLEAKLTDYAKGNNGEIAVLTVPSLGGLSIEEYGIRVAEKWKVGKYGQDNGEIFIIAVGDRKVRIETGSASKITDGQAAQILLNAVVPHLHTNDWDGGITAGVDAIINSTK